MAWFGHDYAAAYRLTVELRVLDAKQPHKEGLHALVWLSLAERFCVDSGCVLVGCTRADDQMRLQLILL